jgi:predicted branched-subunit amino acid permease
MQENNNSRMGLRDGTPIAIGYVVISFAVGFFASTAGLKWIEAFLISALNLTSAGQIAAIPIIAAGGSLIELALTQLVINSRYFLMSISLSQRFGESVSLRDRFIIAFFNTDEIFAVACAKETMLGRKYLYSMVVFPYIGWSFGTLAGAILGGVLPTLLTAAMSVAIYAMFIAIVVPQAKAHLATVICVLLSIAFSITFDVVPKLKTVPKGMVIVIITVVLSAFFALVAPISEHDPWEEEDVK